jgi:hypothetical protein
MSFIIRQRTATGRVNIHLATSVHRPGKTPCHTRQHLGTLDPVTGELLWARHLPEPDDYLRALLAKKGIQYLGRRTQGPGRGSPNRAAISNAAGSVKLDRSVYLEELGRPGLLQQIAQESGLAEAVMAAFGDSAGARLLWVAMHLLCEGDPLSMIEDWAVEVRGQANPLLAVGAIIEALQAVGGSPAARRSFFLRWIEARGMPAAVMHDTSSVTTYSRLLEETEWGYQREITPGPQFNFTMAVDRQNRWPLWYRTQPVALPDIATLNTAATRVNDLGLDDVAYTFDRGYFSQANLAALLEQGLHFTIGIPLHLEQAEDLLQRHWQTLIAFKHAFLFQGAMVGHVPCVYTLKLPDGSDCRLAAHLYYHPERREQLSARLGRAVLALRERASAESFNTLAEGRHWLAENAGNYDKYFAVTKRAGKVTIQMIANRVELSSRKFGVTLIVTSVLAGSPHQPTRELVLAEYRGRELTDRLSELYRQSQGPAPLAVGDVPLAEGRIFLAFLALTWRTMLESRLRQINSPRPLTPLQALVILKKIKRLHPASGAPMLLEVPRRARELLTALKLTPEQLTPPPAP